jgi:DNA mismatch repair protein MutL
VAVRILDEQLANTIAAGEVVERPASVVKELVENALDASALRVRVTLGAGGRDLVRVTDDGSGMDRADATMCLERHATSKIRSAEDLFRLGTLGFRGEAIPSIASVARFELRTRTHDAPEGTAVRVEGGRLLDVGPAGMAPGTDVVVRDLFFNVPARRKFLRSAETELGHCLEVIQREALVRADVDWEVVHDGRTVFRAPPTPDWRARAVEVVGPHGEQLLPVSFARGSLQVRGMIAPVGVHRGSAAGTSWLYVNGRFVKDPLLRRAVTVAYDTIVPKGRWPVVVLDVCVPADEVDVNVHPAKTEVRFANGHALQQAVIAGLRDALRAGGIQEPVATEARYRPAGAAPAQVALGVPVARVREAPDPLARELSAAVSLAGLRPSWKSGASAFPASLGGGPAPRNAPGAPRTAGPPADAAVPAAGPEAASAVEVPPAPAGGVAGGATPRPMPIPTVSEAARRALLPVPRWQDLHVVGQLAGTYLLCEGLGELIVVDQHAAHERIMLERLRREPLALGHPQQLLVPPVVTLAAAAARHLSAHAEDWARHGLDVRDLGGGRFAVQSVPAGLARVDLPALLAELADEAAETVHGMAVHGPLDHALATMACHGSVRAGQELTHGEMRDLLVQLDTVDFEVCAHGRPVAVRIGRGELERRFHRA